MFKQYNASLLNKSIKILLTQNICTCHHATAQEYPDNPVLTDCCKRVSL